MRRGKKKPCYTRSTSRAGQTWKHILNDNGELQPFACPKCGYMIVIDDRNFVGCGMCAWSPSMMTQAERADMEARDPEMIAIFRFLQKAEAWVPSFEGHANTKKMSGKERREKRFLSKCSR